MSLYHGAPQTAGTIAHRAIDHQEYSSKKSVLQGMPVYSEKYGISGNIDTFDTATGVLTERKKKISQIYLGNCLQLVGQYLCLAEMGYDVRSLRLHSLDDNKNYPVGIPTPGDISRFEEILDAFKKYRIGKDFVPNPRKCEKCTYRTLCDISPP
jgi:CRISPR-associated protein Cas4